MKVCMQMLYTQGWLELAKITIPNIVNYCRKHGYSWNIQCISEPYDAFEKITSITKMFESGEADVVVSLDCDSLITNHSIKIESFLDDVNKAYFCNDYNGLNAGIFIIKKSDWSGMFLFYCLNLKGVPNMDSEQDAINHFVKYCPIKSKIKILPHPSINSYLYKNYPEIPEQEHKQGEWEKGDFILHLPALTIEKRISIFNDIKYQIIYE